MVDSFSSITLFISEFLFISSVETFNTKLIFPDTFNTVTELQKLNFIEYSKVVLEMETNG